MAAKQFVLIALLVSSAASLISEQSSRSWLANSLQPILKHYGNANLNVKELTKRSTSISEIVSSLNGLERYLNDEIDSIREAARLLKRETFTDLEYAETEIAKLREEHQKTTSERDRIMRKTDEIHKSVMKARDDQRFWKETTDMLPNMTPVILRLRNSANCSDLFKYELYQVLTSSGRNRLTFSFDEKPCDLYDNTIQRIREYVSSRGENAHNLVEDLQDWMNRRTREMDDTISEMQSTMERMMIKTAAATRDIKRIDAVVASHEALIQANLRALDQNEKRNEVELRQLYEHMDVISSISRSVKDWRRAGRDSRHEL